MKPIHYTYGEPVNRSSFRGPGFCADFADTISACRRWAGDYGERMTSDLDRVTCKHCLAVDARFTTEMEAEDVRRDADARELVRLALRTSHPDYETGAALAETLLLGVPRGRVHELVGRLMLRGVEG